MEQLHLENLNKKLESLTRSFNEMSLENKKLREQNRSLTETLTEQRTKIALVRSSMLSIVARLKQLEKTYEHRN